MFRRGIATTLLVVSSGCSTVADHGDSTLDAPPSAPALEVPPARDAEQTPPLRPIDPNARFEGDIKVPRGTWGAGIAGKRWPNRTVPYALAPGFPYEERVRDAIAHWQSKTVLRFVPRTNETDYVRFVAGHGCAAHVGRQGGAQEVELAAGEHVSSLVGVDFSPADGKAHYFWWSGYRSVGRSSDPDEHETLTRFAVAAGKTPSMILDVAFAPNGQVYAWYRDGTYSIGTPADLGATQAAQPFTTPSGRRASDIVGVAIAANGRVLAWYADGTFSEGTASSLALHAAPQPYALPAGRTRSELLGFGVANDGHVHAWYSSGKASAGTSADLGSFRAPFAVAWMGHCGVPQTIHEIGHAVGLFHEQSRLDRDTHVTVVLANVLPVHAHNFDKHGYGNDHGAYDFDSVMHYDSYAFSSNGQPTIVRKNGGLIPDPTVLSAGDVASIAAMYP